MTSETPAVYSRKNPFPAPLLVNRKLNLDGSAKEIRHLEFSLEGSGLTYTCGDSLGVLPKNCPELVEELIQALHATGGELVSGVDGATKSLRAALLTDYQITQPSKQFAQAIAERGDDGAPLMQALMDPLRHLDEYLWGLEYIDLLRDHPSIRFTAEEFVGYLRKLQPRLYSIASSQKANPDSVHLTVAALRYESHGRQRKGVASTFLTERLPVGESVPVFVHVAKGFRLPEDPATPVIMVGPGTGVAPFRAFLQERKAVGGGGRNWLFFGDQHAKTDFIYQEEFQSLMAEGILTRLDTAFSRDQERKIYVQHRMSENAAEIWRWLQDGAHFFVCGDASRMAKDVDATLHQIVQNQGGMSPDQAREYLETLKKEKRYKRDVY